MYDPSKVVADIKIFGKLAITVWHIDPETDGSDDSCGWFSPKLTDRERKIIDDRTKLDMEIPYFSSPFLPLTVVDPECDYGVQMLVGDCLSHVAAAWLHIAWARDRRKKLTIDELWNVINLSSNPYDNLRTILVDPDEDAESKIEWFFSCVMKSYLRYRRHWWKHPRWHIHHWRIQIHSVQRLRRWLFSRCAYCGKRFPWRYSPISTWGGESYWHRDCHENLDIELAMEEL